MQRSFILWAGVFGALGVLCGAFGAHALRSRISPEALGWFETGTRYHLIHALALFGTGLAAGHVDDRARRVAGACFAGGIVLFAGSLYAMALGGPRLLGAITPLGGAAWIVGWIAISAGSARRHDDQGRGAA